MKTSLPLVITGAVWILSGCQSPKIQCPPPGAGAPNPCDEGSEILTLDQGWGASEQTCFYETSQGSQLIPFSWIVALEQADHDTRFLSDEHIEELGFLARGFDPSQPNDPSRLPIGFVKDGDNDAFGFTCAACHTSELEYQGIKIRIDGAGTLGNMPLLLHHLTAAIEQTVSDPQKQARFVRHVLGTGANPTDVDALKTKLSKYLDDRIEYDRRNASDLEAGNGRLDAFGRIYNRALALTLAGPDNFNPPDAPVSYPFLWGTHQSDYVQWVGFASNSNVGPLARNAGEVLGVFASASAESSPHHRGYQSSARMDALLVLEDWVHDLQAPVWPEDILGPIDPEKAERGRQLYQKNCVECHNLVDRTDKKRKVVAWMENIDAIGTDPRTALNIVNRSGKTGILEGRKSKLIAGARFLKEAKAINITGNIVLGLLASDIKADLETEYGSIKEGRGGKDSPKQGSFYPDNPLNNQPNASLLAYKGRSLTGAWATAPYLHNGSVPTLYQLLTPEADRVKSFDLGSREFDPKQVGFHIEQPNKKFTFKVNDENNKAIPGNSNLGHSGPGYGTDLSEDDKWALIEYMKTEMNP